MSRSSAEFPLIPLLIKEAIFQFKEVNHFLKPFPLIPLLIKEAIGRLSESAIVPDKFPLIPLLIKEAIIISMLRQAVNDYTSFH